MRVFVTGGAGYIGRVLVPILKDRGFDVTVLDMCYLTYDNVSKEFSESGVKLIKEDIRYFDPNILRGNDAVVDLAAISNDPSGELDPMLTWDINYIGRVRVARLAKKIGIKRYIVSSSCSVYGFKKDISYETTLPNPITTYAQANVAVEKDNLELADVSFVPTALRFATAFGKSRRMRLDIAINAMTYGALKSGKIRLMRDGTQYRPFVHVKDISEAIIKVLESDELLISGEVFNIGSNRQNVQLKDLAEVVRSSTGIDSELDWYGDPDTRSYQVSFDKAKKILGYEAKVTIKEGVDEIMREIQSKNLIDRPEMHTVNIYRQIIAK